MKQIWYFIRYSDPFILLPILAAGAGAAVILLTMALFYTQLPNRLPLFYSLPWGADELAGKQQFFLLPVLLVAVTLFNLILASRLHPLQYSLKRILAAASLLCSLIILTTALHVLFIFIT